MRNIVMLAVALLAAACHHEHGNEGYAVGPAELEVVYLDYRVPAVYLLFVADVGAPGAPGRWSGSAGAGSLNAELHENFTDDTTNTTIEGHPIVIRGATLRADGKSFDLTDGNVLVVHLSSSGSLAVTQLPVQHPGHLTPNAIVPSIKAALPHDARVQALP